MGKIPRVEAGFQDPLDLGSPARFGRGVYNQDSVNPSRAPWIENIYQSLMIVRDARRSFFIQNNRANKSNIGKGTIIQYFHS